MDGFGPSGETIIDYSVYDALRAGFAKVVFVIRKDFEQDFREKISDKYRDRIDVRLVFQSLDNIPQGFSLHPERSKPLGTGHAVWCAREHLTEPFAVINADDFYGPSSFHLMADYLSALDDSSIAEQTMVGYKLTNTLSENGTVSRGVCQIDPQENTLQSITERTKIYAKPQGGVVYCENESEYPLSGEEVVSMNMMGFTSAAVAHFDAGLRAFLGECANELKREFYLPSVLNALVQNGHSRVKVLKTEEQWYGVTYPEDRPGVVRAITEMVDQGVYPSPLW